MRMCFASIDVARVRALACPWLAGLVALGLTAPAAAQPTAPAAAAAPAAAPGRPAAPTAPPIPSQPAAAQPAAPQQPATAATPKAQGHTKEPPPPPPARVWLIAPSPGAPWTLRIDNEGERPMRIAADVRLLSLEIEVPDKRDKKKTVRCAVPAGMRPEGFPEKRALLLPPGHSYIEELDPRLLCFGKDAAALTGGVTVHGRLGWSPPPAWSKKPPEPPFIAQSTDDPAAFAAARGLSAPTLVLSYGALAGGADAAAPPTPAAGDNTAPAATDKSSSTTAGSPAPAAADKPSSTTDEGAPPAPGAPSPGAGDRPAPPSDDRPAPQDALRPPPIVDANAPRLELSTDPWSDASSPRRVSITVKAANAGKRPMTVALLPRMFEFRVDGPHGSVICDAAAPTDAVPRDFFRTLKPGASATFNVLLKEVCPDVTFLRQGLYRITATLHANESGSSVGLDVYTAVVPAKNSTLVRLQEAPEPFHAAPPKAVPTPKPEGEESE